MTDTIKMRLDAHGIVLPKPAAPAANYVPFGRAGNLLFISGQLPMKDGKLASTGLLGRDVDVAAGQEAARLCAINILAQAQAALGDLEQLKSVLRISVLVASTPDFTDQHLVGNGASFTGYRVQEQLAGIGSTTAVGRTTAVTGTLQYDGKQVTSVEVVADLSKLASDRPQRDGQLRNQGIEYSKFPTATFKLTSPIAISSWSIPRAAAMATRGCGANCRGFCTASRPTRSTWCSRDRRACASSGTSTACTATWERRT